MTSVLSAIAAAVALLWLGQRWLIYFPMGDPPSATAVGLPHAQTVAFLTEDGLTLEAWYVPPLGPPSGHTVLVFGGNGGHRALRAPLAAALSARGIGTFLADYRGYGGNPGLPSERGLVRDARASVACLSNLPGVDPDRIVYFGESLGAAVATRLATEAAPAGLILRSPFTSLTEIGEHHYPFLPVRWLLRDRFPVTELLTRLHVPVLVVAGEDDSVVPAAFSEQVFNAAHEPKTWVVVGGADHNDAALAAGDDLVDAIASFLGGARQYRVQ